MAVFHFDDYETSTAIFVGPFHLVQGEDSRRCAIGVDFTRVGHLRNSGTQNAQKKYPDTSRWVRGKRDGNV